jgi:hypothetical protein
MRKDDWLTGWVAPIFVVDLSAVFGGDVRHAVRIVVMRSVRSRVVVAVYSCGEEK